MSWGRKLAELNILRAGRPPKACIPEFGTYPDMFQKLLGPDYDYSIFAVDEGELPASPTACDAYLVTGASAGVYDLLPWIASAEEFLRQRQGPRRARRQSASATS